MPDATPARRDDSWSALLGPAWPAGVVLAALLAFAVGAAQPLADPDLGMHLRVGEWIAAHGALPRTEPFAWTRAGAPYFAYSWAAELAMWLALRAGGATALHLLYGCVTLAAAVAAWGYARAARLPRAATLLLPIAHLLAGSLVVPFLRPHAALQVAAPLAWAAATLLARPEADRRTVGAALALWFGAAALAANTHLLAPIVGAPLLPLALAALGARGPAGAALVRRAALGAGVVALGLLATPYALDWPAILRLNFAPNALFRFPTPIGEHTPGGVAVLRPPAPAAALAVALLLLPWLAGAADASAVRSATGATSPADAASAARRARAGEAAFWLAGALLFAMAVRGLALWWLLALPLAGAALARLPAASPSPVGRLARWLLLLAPLAPAAAGARDWRTVRAWEGDATRRTFAHTGALAALAAADTLEARVPNGAGRVLTTFDYGNALLWRLTRHTLSIDGRTIFPDSAALLDAYRRAGDSTTVPLVAGSADLAILPARHAANLRLAALPGWRRLALVRVEDPRVPADTAALWARDAWLARRAPAAASTSGAPASAAAGARVAPPR